MCQCKLSRFQLESYLLFSYFSIILSISGFESLMINRKSSIVDGADVLDIIYITYNLESTESVRC